MTRNLPGLALASFLLALPFFPAGAMGLTERLSGKILLQVEAHGEAWYVSPTSGRRLFLGRPADAFSLLRTEGVGITNADLSRIPIGLTMSTGSDLDADGLSDIMEDAIGTNRTLPDTDGDGYPDYTELAGGYNPLGSGRLAPDAAFANQQRGRIFLQVEAHGEAWWVNPDDGKRYFLGRPADAFALMRGFGLGITNGDLAQIPTTDGVAQATAPSTAQTSVVPGSETTFVSKDAPVISGSTLTCADNDLDCLIDSVQVGSSGEVRAGREWTEDGIHTVSRETWKFGTLPGGRYGFSMITDERLMEMDPAMKAQLLTIGTPLTELEQSEADIAALASKLTGTNQFCVITDRIPLISALTRWKTTARASADLDFAQCCTFNRQGQSEPGLACDEDFPDIQP
jgi:hypothetical protein